MGQQSFAGLAVLIALFFAVAALSGCAATAQATGPALIAAPAPSFDTPEFHGAAIGEDALRARLQSED
ncbi:MAG: hypothetical protein R3C25_02300 [Hyphomonadaceae bacterium]